MMNHMLAWKGEHATRNLPPINDCPLSRTADPGASLWLWLPAVILQVMAAFQTTRRMEFCDTDMAGIVHFANFFRFMEAAEHAWFRSLGLKIAGELATGETYGWPRVSTTCNYQSPARYEDVLTIDVRLTHRGSRSLSTVYEFSRDGQPIARGEMKTVFCLI